MTVSTEYTEHVLEHLEPVLPVRTTRFFGGVGLYAGAVQFGMIIGNSLYFVVDDNTRARYEQAGMGPFSYAKKNSRVQVRKYYELPEDVLTDPIELRAWARAAIDAASKSKKPKSKKMTKTGRLRARKK